MVSRLGGCGSLVWYRGGFLEVITVAGRFAEGVLDFAGEDGGAPCHEAAVTEECRLLRGGILRGIG